MDKALQGYIIGVLRRGFSRCWSRRFVLEAAKAVYLEGNRRRVHFRCACCSMMYDRKEVQVDHIIPVIAMAGFDNFDAIIARMYCGPEGLQVLCKSCHKLKSKDEAGVRALARPKKPKKQARSLQAAGDADVRDVQPRRPARRKLRRNADGADGTATADSEQQD